MTDKNEITVKRAFTDQNVHLDVVLDSYRHGASIVVKGSFDITTARARELAAELIAEADRSDSFAQRKKVEK